MSNHVKGMTSCRPPEKSNESEIKSNESEMDLINRQAAIDTAEAMHDRCDTLSVDDYRDMMVEALTVLPSVQPECTGKWIYQTKFGRIECNVCGHVFKSYVYPRNFCPNCGAKMEG